MAGCKQKEQATLGSLKVIQDCCPMYAYLEINHMEYSGTSE